MIESSEKIICYNCKEEIDVFVTNCPKCGTELYIKCPNCGRMVSVEEGKCCGICLVCN